MKQSLQSTSYCVFRKADGIIIAVGNNKNMLKLLKAIHKTAPGTCSLGMNHKTVGEKFDSTH